MAKGKNVFRQALQAVLFLIVCSGIANGAEYAIGLNGQGQKVYCQDVLMDREHLRCSDGSASYMYETSSVASITYDGSLIYPYKNRRKIKTEDITPENCQQLYDQITGPLLLEKDKYSYFIIARMLENGVCINENIDQAKQYYLKSGSFGKKDYARLVDKSRVEVDEQLVRSLQEDANRKRERRENWDAKCQKECRLGDNVENKYRYSTKCYNDCMSYMPED